MDKRWYELANLLVNQSTKVQSGERVMIAMREIHTLPLVRAVYDACIKAGAHVQIQFLSDYLDHALMEYGTSEQINQVPEIEAYGMEWADVYIGLRGTHNLYELASIPDEILAQNRRTMGKISTLRWEKTRWVIVRVPNEDFAQQAETDVETITDMFFNACLRDRSAEVQRWLAVADILNQGREVRLVANETDLIFSVEGRTWKVSEGSRNMPGGEILTAPVTSTVNGFISFEWPGVFGGRLVHDIRLEWRDGQLISATASKNQEYMRRVIATDPGASLIGEFALGTNFYVDRFCKDIFYDEKIGGTVHIALGRAYPEVGGTNRSAIHWDLIKDTRQNGVIYLDGRKIFEKGQILV
jgi:aminopeptidase